MTPTQFSTDSVAPALIAAALDRLARIPPTTRLHPEFLVTMARSIGCDDREMPALLVRIRAAAFVLADPRWLPWSAYFRTCETQARCVFDAGLLSLIAELPLNAELRFETGRFFDALLAVAEAGGQC